LLLKLVKGGWIGLIVYAWAELTEALQEFMTRLKHDGLAEGAAEIRAWLDSVGSMCREFVAQLGDAKMIELRAVTHCASSSTTAKRRSSDAARMHWSSSRRSATR